MVSAKLLTPAFAACILFTTSLIYTADASGDKIFVAPDSAVGKDADCSEDFPCSLKHGLAIAGAGADIEFGEGKYRGNVVIHVNQTGLSLNGAGASLSVIESNGTVFDSKDIVLDIHASGVSANRIGFIQGTDAAGLENGTAQIGVLIRDTAARTTLDEVNLYS